MSDSTQPTDRSTHEAPEPTPTDLQADALSHGQESLEDVLDAVKSSSQGRGGSLSMSDATTQAPRRTGLTSLWTPAETIAEQLPDSTLRRLTFRPAESLAQMLGSLGDSSRAMRSGLSIREVGTVRQVGDGVASVWGLPQATTDELLLFSNNVLGLVMNLEPQWIDCILLGSDEGIQGGDAVWSTGQRISMPVGEQLIGRVVNPLGQPVDGRGRVFTDERRFIERDAPGVVERQAVAEPLQTGVKAVDAIIPVGKGQRELIIGDRQTGKTSLALDAIINQRGQDVMCVYVSIGQRKSAALQTIRTLEQAGAMEHTAVVLAAPDDPPSLLYLAPYAGCTIAEYFLDAGMDVLIIYDDLTKHADAYRELSLLLRRPPGREAYPGDIFYLHSRLLERACRLHDNEGGGSITALPIIETRRGNIQAYIPTNLISITDGQIFLNADLFNQNIKPAVDAGLSVSRVGGAAQTPIMRKISGQFKLMLAQYEEIAHFSRFGAEIDRATQQQITRGLRLRQILRQDAYHPIPLAEQIVVLYAAGQGHLDAIALDQVETYERELLNFCASQHGSLLRRIETEKQLSDEIAELIDALLADFDAQRG